MRNIYKLDYALELEHAAQRAAAQCAAYARPRLESVAAKLRRSVKALAFIHLNHLNLKAHEGVFTAPPPALADAQSAASITAKALIKKLTGVKLSAAYAQNVWPLILEHKWYLSERLGRDVGLRVAAVDYFENIEPPPRTVSAWAESNALPPRLPMMLPFSKRFCL